MPLNKETDTEPNPIKVNAKLSQTSFAQCLEAMQVPLIFVQLLMACEINQSSWSFTKRKINKIGKNEYHKN